MIDQIEPQQVKDWLQQSRDGQSGKAYVLDVREAWEVQTAHLQDPNLTVIHIPMGELSLRLAQLDRNDTIACLCHHGGRSMHVAQFLAHNGFTQLANIAGGIHAWSSQVDARVPTY